MLQTVLESDLTVAAGSALIGFALSSYTNWRISRREDARRAEDRVFDMEAMMSPLRQDALQDLWRYLATDATSAGGISAEDCMRKALWLPSHIQEPAIRLLTGRPAQGETITSLRKEVLDLVIRHGRRV